MTDSTSKGTILVVEDQSFMRYVARQVLETFEFKVLTTNDGAAAVELFRRFSAEIVLVLLDRQLPRLNGDTALQEILRLSPETHIILLNGECDPLGVRKASGKSHVSFLAKPYSPSALIESVMTNLHQTSLV